MKKILLFFTIVSTFALVGHAAVLDFNIDGFNNAGHISQFNNRAVRTNLPIGDYRISIASGVISLCGGATCNITAISLRLGETGPIFDLGVLDIPPDWQNTERYWDGVERSPEEAFNAYLSSGNTFQNVSLQAPAELLIYHIDSLLEDARSDNSGSLVVRVEEIVNQPLNDLVTFEPNPSTYEFTTDTTDCQTEAVGKFTFDATLTNISEKELSNLHIEVDELTNDNLLLNDEGLKGEGDIFKITFDAENVALNADVELKGAPFFEGGWGGGQIVSKDTIVDGIFLPRGQQWDQGAVWWDSTDEEDRYIEINLDDEYTINSLIVQADDNDAYKINYWDLTNNSWQLAWDVPNFDAIQPMGMVTRPNPDDDTERYFLPNPITTDALLFRGDMDDSDRLFSVSEIQAFTGAVNDYSDGILSPGEFVDVPFTVCLQEKSPFRFFVNVFGTIDIAPPEFLFKWGSPGTGDGEFADPHGIAIDSLDNVYIVDSRNYRVQKFTSGGTFITKWGSPGTGDGQFEDETLGIAIDSLDNVYVADGNQRIQKFTNDGTFIIKWGSAGTGDGQFNKPSEIATDSSDNVYVVDENNHRVQKFSKEGTFIKKWGSFGTGNGQFILPEGITIDSQDNVYISEFGGDRIQKFTSEGSFIMKWGSSGNGDGEFGGPNGVAVDSLDNVYVVEEFNERGQVFTNNGVFITKWGTAGNGDGEFSGVRRIEINSFDYIYVSEIGNDRIQVFR